MRVEGLIFEYLIIINLKQLFERQKSCLILGFMPILSLPVFLKSAQAGTLYP